MYVTAGTSLQSQTLKPIPRHSGTWNPEPGTWNLEPGTRNPEPGTRNPEPETQNLKN
ncbi:MAG: hypothetical protein WC780_16485 [Lentimicrobiaceae bacterium]